jgi:hypothetical protein
MEEKSKISRRGFFRGAATIAGAALATTVIPIRVANAQSKADKASMKYQDHPKDGQRCDECVYFQAPKSCGIVAGDISPQGWCVAFNKKK